METPGLATALAPPSYLPLRYMLTGVAFYVAAQAALLARAGDLGLAGPLWWPLAGIAHLFTLGWATAVMMGATLQLIPVLLRTRLRGEAAARAAWPLFTAGAALLSWSLLVGRPTWLPPAAALLVAGIGVYGGVVVASLRAAPRGPLQRWALGWAVGFLAATALLGAALTLSLRLGAAGDRFGRLLGAHLATGLGGWLSGVIFSVGYRLIPMFALSHGHSRRGEAPAVGLLLGGSAALALASLAGRVPYTAAGGAALAAAYAIFVWQVVDMVRHRRRRRLEPVTRFTMVGLAFASLAVILATAAVGSPSPAGASRERLALAAGYAFLGGWVSLMVAGHLLKIVPFLTWLDRYAERAAVEKVPLVRDLFSPWLGEATLLLTAGGAALGVIGFLTGGVAVLRGAFSLTLAGSVCLAAALLQVRAGWRHVPRP